MYITQERLKQVLTYMPDTGEFIWAIPKSGSKGIGQQAGTITGAGYRDVCIDGKKYGLHRLAFLYMLGEIPDNVDHKNGTKDDNRWLNLRPASIRENAFNYKGWGAKSTYKNVYHDKRGNKNWFVVITLPDGSKKRLGYFYTPEEANTIAISARKTYHGEFYHETVE